MIKNLIIKLYRYTRYLYFRYIKAGYYKNFKLYQNCELTAVSEKKEFYFGYYNICPENISGDIIFCDISEKDRKEINIILKKLDKEIQIGTTTAYNMQQGCMLQWGSTNNNLIYYNRYNRTRDSYECVVFDSVKMCEKRCLPLPIYALSKQEDYALSLNFDRLAEMRPDYGYFCRGRFELPDDSHDGIWKIDIKTNSVSLIITLQQLIDLKPVDSMIGARHKVNHIDICPNGDRFMFLHRWIGPQGRYMRLITADRNGDDLYILNGDKMSSHSCWLGNDRIISFCYTNEFGNNYIEFIDKSEIKKKISNNLPKVDGHPILSPDCKWMITDSYPQLNRFSSLYLYNFDQDKCFVLGRFYQPLKYLNSNRIDLHPKLNQKCTKIYFESGHRGRKALYSLTVDKIFNNG